MSDPVAEEPEGSDGPVSKLDAALGSFKPRARDADISAVSDSGRPRMNWDPVTDTGGGGATDTQPRSSFQFDLGSALARLSGTAEPESADTGAPNDEHDQPAADEPLPVRGRDGSSEPLEPLPVRGGDGLSEPLESLPVRGGDGLSEPLESLPVRGGDGLSEPLESLPVRGGDGLSESPESLPVRGGDGLSEPLEPLEPLPVRERRGPSESLPATTPPSSASTTPPVADLPTRPSRPNQPVDPARAVTAAGTSTKRSVFDDAAPAPSLPAAGSPVVPAAHDVGAPPAAVVAVPAGMPMLPSAMPAAAPAITAPVESAPSTPQLNALRSAQLRANRNDRRGKLLGRSLLAFLVVGGLMAAALLFGRSYLFPTEWTAELTPLVDEVQSGRGAEFDHTLALVERPATEYGPLVTEHLLGEDWSARLPEWRALGLAAGDGAVADVQARVAGLYPAFYDADADELVAAAGVSPDGREAALRLALETALVDQLTDGDPPETPGLGLTGLESMDAVARQALDAAASGVAGSAPDSVTDLAGVPLPVAYQLRAIDELGEDLLADVPDPRPGSPLPQSAALLDDGGNQAIGGLRQPGDQLVLEPVTLGPDAWALIWGAQLPPPIAGRMADAITADSYSVVTRSGATCFLAVFEAKDEGAGAALLSDLTAWAVTSPTAAEAAAAQLGPARVQVEGCDPGVDAATAPAIAAIDLVLQRQLDRLAGR